MCGLVAAIDFKGRPVNNGILQQYDKQRARGQEGFGYYDGQVNHIVKATTENKILKWLVKHDSHMIVFHHRYPTSTANVKRAAHPFSTKGYFGDTQYVLVHNGVIRNSDELHADHVDEGITYSSQLPDGTFNDSEGLLWDFARYMEGLQDDMQAIGDMAFICVKLVNNKIERLYFYRNRGRPLNMLRSTEGIMLSSEGPGEEIEMDTLFNWNYSARRLYQSPLSVRMYKPYKSEYTGGMGPLVPSFPGDEFIPGSYADERRYEEYWRNQEAGEQLGDYLRQNYPHYYQNGSPRLKKQGSFLVMEGDRIAEILDTPSDNDIQNSLMGYLSLSAGNFERAHFYIEDDYQLLEVQAQSKDVKREKLLLDLVLQRLDADPDYVNEDSISSLWSDLWNQSSFVNA